MLTATQRVAFAAGLFVGVALGIPAGAIVVGTAQAEPVAQAIEEDQPGWDCRTMGNRICGPDNAQGLAAACYNDQAEVVAPWPCHLVVNPATGDADVYEG
ncbi:hypothetical protein A5784_14035 [Mycobacterium sp. 852013-50091_SCH5140682]|uniref:hypothetical protein n=1 Tax=Mycobacterium sp. 852013-50091_SCH5140682 TaxID=1834109 RepID=UPI0007EAF91F|nr:hypothetical protein [Mycobacterium sp. 852013-50091_SCH5140682]OBC03354.1 hypothetical protein A5784_14035 [Mycobacterium sp. 852013-50091_SCH5140682]